MGAAGSPTHSKSSGPTALAVTGGVGERGQSGLAAVKVLLSTRVCKSVVGGLLCPQTATSETKRVFSLRFQGMGRALDFVAIYRSAPSQTPIWVQSIAPRTDRNIIPSY